MNEIKEPLTRQAEAAFRKASETVVRQARQTGTPILIWEDGQIRQVSADRLETTEPPYTPVAPVQTG